MAASPTTRSLKYLRDQGYTCEITEHWNPHARIRQDLFGFVDLIALGENETLAIQTTSGDNVSKRIDKIINHDNYAAVRAAGWRIIVHGWRKNSKNRWVLREVEITVPSQQ